MSISDKLVTIAENQRRVYDKGYSEGSALFDGLVLKTMTQCNIPEGATEIKNGLFWNNDKLESVTMPSSVVRVGNQGFQGCTNLKDVNLPNGFTTFAPSAFYGCNNLVLTKLPDALKFIQTSTFMNCHDITITEIPKSVTTIGAQAFQNCASLRTITFLGTPTTLANNAFSGCTNLTAINVPWAEGDTINANKPWGATNAKITYNAGKIKFYWKCSQCDTVHEFMAYEDETWEEFLAANSVECSCGNALHSFSQNDPEGYILDSIYEVCGGGNGFLTYTGNADDLDITDAIIEGATYSVYGITQGG